MPIVGSVASASISSFGRSVVNYGGSAYFAGGSQFLRVNNTGTNYEYGTGPWTLEFWYRPTTNAGTRVLWSQQFSSRRFWIYAGNGQLYWVVNSNASIVTSLSLTSGAWNHIAFVRNTATSTATFYINGVACGSTSSTANYTGNQYGPLIGNLNGQIGTYPAAGYLTNLRLAKAAIYTSNFTPSRVPFTRTSQGATNVQLLLNERTSAELLTDSSVNNTSIVNSSPATTWSSLNPYTEAYVTPPAIVITSATITPSTLTPNEGDTVTFTVAGTNTANGTYYYTIEPGADTTTLTTGDFTSASLSGSFTITGNAGSFTITLTKDLLTDASEVFSVFVRTTSITGTIIGISEEITIGDISLTPVFTAVPASISEGSSGTFTVQNVGPDGTYYWTVLHSTTVTADFTSSSGSFVVSGSVGGVDNGTGSFSVPVAADFTTEGSQTFQVQVRSGSTSGTVILTSSAVTVTDTSLTPSVSSIGSVNENSASLVFTASNVGPNGTYYWTINNTTTSNADFSAVSGSFTVSGSTGGLDNGSGTFSVTTVPDYLTEGNQEFTVSVRSGSIAGTVIVTSDSTTLVDSSTTVSASGSPTSFNEGASTTITASATGFPNGTYYWTVLNGTTTNADFSATSGSFVVSNSTSGSFTVTAALLGGAEGAETFSVQIRTDSTSGTVIATTGTLTINANAS